MRRRVLLSRRLRRCKCQRMSSGLVLSQWDHQHQYVGLSCRLCMPRWHRWQRHVVTLSSRNVQHRRCHCVLSLSGRHPCSRRRPVRLHTTVSCRYGCGYCASLALQLRVSMQCVVCPVPSGYFCPSGATVATPCGSAQVYCPVGSSAPTTVLDGYFSAGGANATVQNQQNQCPSGSYCVSGLQVPCPAGTFRGTVGASSVLGCTTCPAGYFCGTGTTTPVECGPDSVCFAACRRSRRV